jgi:hypothetical protein
MTNKTGPNKTGPNKTGIDKIGIDKAWPLPITPKPQVCDLPRDGHIDVTCKSCRRQWRNSIRHMVEHQRVGAQFVDLLEWQSRCACGGMVCFTVDDGADVRQAA